MTKRRSIRTMPATRILLSLLILFSLFILTGCSKNGSFEKGVKLSQTIQTNEKYRVGDESKTAWVLQVPAGAFESKAGLEMNVLSVENSKKLNAPQGNVVGNVVEISAKANDTSVAYLNKPVTLLMKIPESQFSKSDEYKYMAACLSDSEWIYAYPSAFDLTTRTVTFETDHFTAFALVNMKEQDLIKKYAADMVRREWEKGNSKTQVLSRLDTAFRDAMSEVGVVTEKDQSSILLKIKKSPKFDKMISDIENGEDVDIQKICTELTTDGIISKYADIPMTEMLPLVGTGKGLGKGFLELSRGNYGDSIKEFGVAIAKAFPTTKIANSVRETIQFGGIASRDWDRFSTNIGYKTYLKYASSTDGRYEIDSPEWNKVMISLYGSTEKALYQSLKEYAEKNKTSIAALQKDQAKSEKIYKEFCDGLNAKYSERYLLEKDLSKIQTDYEKIAQGFIKEGFLERGSFGYTSEMSLKARLESLFEARAYILDLFGGKMPILALGESSQTNLNQAITEYILARGDTARFFKWLEQKGYIKHDTSETASPTPTASTSTGSSSITTTKPQVSQVPTQSKSNAFAWVLVETIHRDQKSDVENTNKGGIYQVSASAAPGKYTRTWKYIGKTDTYPDPDQLNGESYATLLTFSVPPTVIRGGETVSLSFNLTFTDDNLSYFDGSGSARADWGNLKFSNAAKKTFFEIISSVKYSSKNVKSISDTISAVIPNGNTEGQRVKLWTGGYTGTDYVYEWKAQS